MLAPERGRPTVWIVFSEPRDIPMAVCMDEDSAQRFIQSFPEDTWDDYSVEPWEVLDGPR